jgi:branched-subunit amino acid transport protein
MTAGNFEVYKYIMVMFGVTYLIRLLPLTLIRREIRNPRVRAFLYYVPYVTLSVMTFPAILHATRDIYSGAAGFVAALVMAWSGQNLFRVSLAACVSVFAVEFFL